MYDIYKIDMYKLHFWVVEGDRQFNKLKLSGVSFTCPISYIYSKSRWYPEKTENNNYFWAPTMNFPDTAEHF